MACRTIIFVQEKHPEADTPRSTIPIERRSKLRFRLDLQVRYRTLKREFICGEGRALDISSCGMLITGPHRLCVGAPVELRIEWPFRLEGRVGLQLVAIARVVRCGPSNFAVFFREHQFRTAKIPAPAAGPISPAAPALQAVLD